MYDNYIKLSLFPSIKKKGGEEKVNMQYKSGGFDFPIYILEMQCMLLRMLWKIYVKIHASRKLGYVIK